MKNWTITLALSFLMLNIAQSQNDWSLNLLGHWDDDDLPIASPNNLKLQYSGCWGLAVNGREYAVLGGARHILFFDVTEPSTPQLIGKFEGTKNTVWREFKSYKNRIYGVSDDTQEGLMIFDLSNAQDTIVRTYWSTEFFNKAHTITLDTVSGRIYLNGGDATLGIMVLDVSQNPDQPIFLSHVVLEGGLLHDSYVRNDTLYASSGFAGLYVYDMKNPLSPVLLAQIGTGGYNHNVWLNTEGTYAYYTEEIPAGRPIQIVDLQLLPMNDLEVVGSFLDKFSQDSVVINSNQVPIATSAIPHNVYIRDNLLFNSQYEDGLLVYDISQPTQPVFLARYDTYPENTAYSLYRGNWGNYPWLPSGNIITGDMQNGLFMLELRNNTVRVQDPAQPLAVDIFPSPASSQLHVRMQSLKADDWSWTLRNTAGQLVVAGSVEAASETTIQLPSLPKGLYFMEIRDAAALATVRKVVVE